MIVYEMKLKTGEPFVGTEHDLIEQGFTMDDVAHKEFLYDEHDEKHYRENNWYMQMCAI